VGLCVCVCVCVCVSSTHQHTQLLRHTHTHARTQIHTSQVRGFAVAGGSDIALSCDLVVMADDAKIGYPPARVWGVPTTAMWVCCCCCGGGGGGGVYVYVYAPTARNHHHHHQAYRVGAERAKRMMFTGDLITGASPRV